MTHELEKVRGALEILNRVREATPHDEAPYNRDALDKVYYVFGNTLEVQEEKDRAMKLMAEALEEIAGFDIQWAYELNINIKKIKSICKQALAEYAKIGGE